MHIKANNLLSVAIVLIRSAEFLWTKALAKFKYSSTSNYLLFQHWNVDLVQPYIGPLVESEHGLIRHWVCGREVVIVPVKVISRHQTSAQCAILCLDSKTTTWTHLGHKHVAIRFLFVSRGNTSRALEIPLQSLYSRSPRSASRTSRQAFRAVRLIDNVICSCHHCRYDSTHGESTRPVSGDN